MTDYLLDNEIRMYTAHVEISSINYNQHRLIAQAMIGADTLIPQLLALPGVTSVARRLELMVLAASDQETIPAILWGVEPEPQKGFVDYSAFISKGEVCPNQLVLGNELANRLGINPGDSVVLIGQTYQGRIAAGIFAVSGIATTPIPDINKNVLVAHLDLVRDLARTPQGATSLRVNIQNKYDSESTKDEIENHLGNPLLEVRTWQETISGWLDTYQLFKAGIIVLKIVMLVLLGFGILGAMMLNHFERKTEYRMLKALGFKPHYLAVSLSIEMVLTSMIGLVAGLLLTIPIALLFANYPIQITGELAHIMSQFNIEPIIVLSTSSNIFIHSSLIVVAITLAISLGSTIPVIQTKRTK